VAATVSFQTTPRNKFDVRIRRLKEISPIQTIQVQLKAVAIVRDMRTTFSEFSGLSIESRDRISMRASDGAWCSGTLRQQGDMTMLNKMTKMALAGALIFGTASAALASNENDGGNETGGYVPPGSMDGVNPAYHPGILGRTDATKAYGFVAAPKQTHRALHVRTNDR
jgi:hypothetical protein